MTGCCAIPSSMKEDSTEDRKRWEKNMRVEIPEEAQLQSWKSQCSTTNSLTSRDFGWKSLIGVFIAPQQKSKMTQLPCWRQCGSMQVDHAHVYRLCPSIRPLWVNLSHLLSRILRTRTDVSFLSCTSVTLLQFYVKAMFASKKSSVLHSKKPKPNAGFRETSQLRTFS